MADQAGIQITADLAALRKELQDARQEFRNFNTDILKAVTGVNSIEAAADNASKKVSFLDLAWKGLGFTLGVLGVQSIQAVVLKLMGMGQEAERLEINLEGVHARAQAIFQDAFPKMVQEAQKLGDQFKRSQSQMLEFETGFATVLDTVGISKDKVQQFSVELTKLTAVLGKAFPDKSDAEIYQTLQMGIEGSTRRLRSLGIVMTTKSLQDYAETQGIKLKVAQMTNEQQTMLRTMYLLDETRKLQEAGAIATGKTGDAAKTTADKWQDLLETLGTNIGPFIAAANESMVGMLTHWVELMGDVKNAFLDIITLEGYSKGQQDVAKLQAGLDLDAQNRALQAARGIGVGVATKGQAVKAYQAEKQSDKDFWALGGDAGAQAAQKAAEERQKLEKDITDSMDKEAKSTADRLKSEKESLDIKAKMGTITDAEEARLQAINNRLDFQKDKVTELSKDWDTLQKDVENYDKQIEEINKKIAAEHLQLADELEKIDDETQKSKTAKLEELLKKQTDLNNRIALGEGISLDQQKELEDINKTIASAQTGGQNDQHQIDQLNAQKQQLIAYIKANGSSDALSEQGLQIDEQLKGLTPASQSDAAALEEAKKLAGMNDLQKIDYEAQQKKKEAEDASKKRLQPLLDELKQAQTNRQQVADLEAQKSKAIADAIDERTAKEEAAYKKEEADLDAHIKITKQQLADLSSAISAPVAHPAPKFASGGPVFGGGGPTDDGIPAWLSSGEYVINSMATRMYRPLLAKINAMALPVPRFATGGPVSSVDDHSRTNIVQNFHNAAMSNPLLHRWHLLRARR